MQEDRRRYEKVHQWKRTPAMLSRINKEIWMTSNQIAILCSVPKGTNLNALRIMLNICSEKGWFRVDKTRRPYLWMRVQDFSAREMWDTYVKRLTPTALFRKSGPPAEEKPKQVQMPPVTQRIAEVESAAKVISLGDMEKALSDAREALVLAGSYIRDVEAVVKALRGS